jgi:diadenosine tetraphosphate (Ap4A) HIT family hydrolase
MGAGELGYCAGADFCQELSGESDTDFHRTYGGEPPSRIIGRTPHLSVIVDMSPLCVGHLLIVSNQHYLSFAGVVRDHRTEVEDVVAQVLRSYETTFGGPVVLEHGSSQDMEGSACITHAHWHILPLDSEAVHQILINDGLEATELGGLEDLAAVAAGGAPYFYCSDGSNQRMYGVGHKMRKQYLRSVAGQLLGIPDPEWDYVVVIRKDAFTTTMGHVREWRIR